VPDKESLMAKSIGIALARWQIAALRTHGLYGLTAVCFLDVVFSGVPDVFMHHTGGIECRTPANTPIPVILVPG
jgi:hypothetical protein